MSPCDCLRNLTRPPASYRWMSSSSAPPVPALGGDSGRTARPNASWPTLGMREGGQEEKQEERFTRLKHAAFRLALRYLCRPGCSVRPRHAVCDLGVPSIVGEGEDETHLWETR